MAKPKKKLKDKNSRINKLTNKWLKFKINLKIHKGVKKKKINKDKKVINV